MSERLLPKAQNPLLLRFHRLMDAFSKGDDERDFYLDCIEGFLLFVDLDKGAKELEDLQEELHKVSSRYLLLPKMTLYETKKFMEGFVNEKVYDIDNKEKLLDIIQSKEARENFLEFIYDHLAELEKWQLYYTERMRIRIIEWLRLQKVQFVFEEDLDLPKNIVEKLKKYLFDPKVSKDVTQAREQILAKSKTYYSNEALNPRPKRGRPPKQQVKVEIEPQITGDLYTAVPPACRTFLYLPDIASASSITFSSRYATMDQFLANLRGSTGVKINKDLEVLSWRLQSLRDLTERLGSMSLEEEFSLSRNVSAEPKKENAKRGLFHVMQEALPPSKNKENKGEKKPTSKVVTPILSRKNKDK